MYKDIDNIIKMREEIRDTELIEININFRFDPEYKQKDQLDIILKFKKEIKNSYKIIILTFNDVIEYSLFYNFDRGRYDVESLKFFYIDDKSKYYFSLDPFVENKEVDDRDNDIIIANKVGLNKLNYDEKA